MSRLQQVWGTAHGADACINDLEHPNQTFPSACVQSYKAAMNNLHTTMCHCTDADNFKYSDESFAFKNFLSLKTC